MAMNIIDMSEREFDEMQNTSIFNHGQESFVCRRGKRVTKVYTNGANTPNKQYTLALAHHYRPKISEPKLIIADTLVRVNKRFRASEMDYAPGKKAYYILSSESEPLALKIKILKDIGGVISRLAECYKKLKTAYGDVHPGNFLYDYATDQTYGLDADSIKILNNEPNGSFYLDNNPNLIGLQDKYPFDAESMFFIPSPDSDILCFIMMIIHMLTGTKVYKFSIDEYHRYLDELDHLGFDSHLLDTFAKVYQKEPNVNPTPYLERLTLTPINKQ